MATVCCAATHYYILYIYMQLVESHRTEISRAHLGHRKDTQHNKHCEEMLGIHYFDKQLWFIPQPFRVKADHRGITDLPTPKAQNECDQPQNE